MPWNAKDKIELYAASVGLLLILVSLTSLTERAPTDNVTWIGLTLFVIGSTVAAYSFIKLLQVTLDEIDTETPKSSSKASVLNCALTITAVTAVIIILQVISIILLRNHELKRIVLECEKGEYTHYENRTVTCRPCDFCNEEYGYCSSAGKCVCFGRGRDPANKCETCLPQWNAGDNCNTCSGNYDILADCSSCVIGFAGPDCQSCADGFGPPGQCNECLEGYFGNPETSCLPCSDCHGGTCLSNDKQEQSFSEDVCTRTAQECVKSTDCVDGGNCAGRCESTRQYPPRDIAKLYDNKVCRTDDECNDPANLYAGKCVNFVCCEESRFGDGTCISCGPGRRPTQCGLCPAYDADRDVDCNGGGTCEGTSNGAICICNPGRSGAYCENTLDGCAYGFYLANETCNACPAVEKNNFNGNAACNGHGVCTSSGECQCDNLEGEFSFSGTACENCTEGYRGDLCEQCAGYAIVNSNVTVCSGHGQCVDADGGKNKCVCDENYAIDESTGSCVAVQ